MYCVVGMYWYSVYEKLGAGSRGFQKLHLFFSVKLHPIFDRIGLGSKG